MSLGYTQGSCCHRRKSWDWVSWASSYLFLFFSLFVLLSFLSTLCLYVALFLWSPSRIWADYLTLMPFLVLHSWMKHWKVIYAFGFSPQTLLGVWFQGVLILYRWTIRTKNISKLWLDWCAEATYSILVCFHISGVFAVCLDLCQARSFLSPEVRLVFCWHVYLVEIRPVLYRTLNVVFISLIILQKLYCFFFVLFMHEMLCILMVYNLQLST